MMLDTEWQGSASKWSKIRSFHTCGFESYKIRLILLKVRTNKSSNPYRQVINILYRHQLKFNDFFQQVIDMSSNQTIENL